MGKPERTFNGSGADEDIVVSSARAYLSALNKLIPYAAAKKELASSLGGSPGGADQAAAAGGQPRREVAPA